MTIRGILFDKDGTLLDFEATWQPVLRQAALVMAGQDPAVAARLLTAGGFDPQTERFRAGSPLAAGNSAEIATLWAEHLGVASAGEMIEKLDRIFEAANRDNAAPVGDLAAVMSALSARGLALGLATSDSEQGAEICLRGLSIREHFAFVAGYDSGHGIKPGPGMVQAFAERVALPTTAVAVVGDNRHDLEMGRAAGAGLLIGVLSGNGGPGDLGGLADHLLSDVTELPGLLERLALWPPVAR